MREVGDAMQAGKPISPASVDKIRAFNREWTEYACPIMQVMLEAYFGALQGNLIGMAGFAVGIAGMSIEKLSLALIDVQFR